MSGPRQVWRSWKERVAARSSGSRRSSTSHRAFWKVPPGAPQPSSFVAEPGRVTRRKSRPSRRCHRPAVTRATARGRSGWRGLCRTALWGWVPSAPGTFWSPFFHRVGPRGRDGQVGTGIAQERGSSAPTRSFQTGGAAAAAACEAGTAGGCRVQSGCLAEQSPAALPPRRRLLGRFRRLLPA